MVIIHGDDYWKCFNDGPLPNGSKESALHVASSEVYPRSSPLLCELLLLSEENVRSSRGKFKGETARDILSENSCTYHCMQNAFVVFDVSKAIVDEG